MGPQFNRFRSFVTALLLVGISLNCVVAAPPVTKDGKAETQSTIAEGRSSETTRQREQIAVEFAREHHRELAQLLKQLKQMDQQGFDNAINELYRVHTRLAKLQSRQPERYQSELEIWKLDSRIRLLVARSASNPDRAIGEIEDLVAKRNGIRITQLQLDRERLADRLQRMDKTLSEYRENADELAQQETERLLKSVRSRQSKSKPPKTQPVSTTP